MNIWICVILGLALAILYKWYQGYKAKKVAKDLKEKFSNVIEDNKVNKDEDINISNDDDIIK